MTMGRQVLITGGAGFIGSHLADALLERGYRVRALDVLSTQVHGEDPSRPSYLHPEVELMVGDVRDPRAVRRALTDVDAVFHLAAAVGVGQSMYEMEAYTDVNNRGTAVLLEQLIEQPVEKLIVASSMSIYGEGLYRDSRGNVLEDADRSHRQLKNGRWELRGESGAALEPISTPETKRPSLSSIYALSKYDQERMCLMIGETYDISTVALRFFNAYGPRQALSNPYTGVLAIFASRLLNEHRPLVYEDGNQRRDFVSVRDVAQACRLALEVPEADGETFNVGSGRSHTINEVAHRVAEACDRSHLRPKLTGKYRAGDIRHCFADISKARDILGYEPQVSLEEGLDELADWLEEQAARDRVGKANAELSKRGLTV